MKKKINTPNLVVNEIQITEAETALKSCPKIVQHYVESLKVAINREQEITNLAKEKIRKLAGHKKDITDLLDQNIKMKKEDESNHGESHHLSWTQGFGAGLGLAKRIIKNISN